MSKSIPFTPQRTATVSREAYDLFDDHEWAGLLRRNGFDCSKKITYHVSAFGCTIKQWDLPTDLRPA